jgi:DNA-binding LacI/PurR family transcriptional regulator
MTSPSTPRILPPNQPDRRVATAHDVARLAGVSQSAVSRTFTAGGSVSAETRQKVLQAAAALGYRPNLVARSLITRRSNIIGVAMAYLENQFYPSVLEALSEAFGRLGYRVLLFTARQGESSDPILEEVLRYRVDALVLASASLSSRFDVECQQAGVPVVLLNRRTESLSVSSVTGDNRGGARTIAAFLAAGGHARFAYMAGLENSSTSREREEGYATFLAAQGLGAPLRVCGHYDFAAAAVAARRLFSGPDRPDAVFCANDHMALATINVARAEFGLEVGREVSIVGFDDAGPAAWPLFSLTTYVQPIRAMVEQLVAMTCARLADPSAPAERKIVPGHLAVRSSARLPDRGIRLVDGERSWRCDGVVTHP